MNFVTFDAVWTLFRGSAVYVAFSKCKMCLCDSLKNRRCCSVLILSNEISCLLIKGHTFWTLFSLEPASTTSIQCTTFTLILESSTKARPPKTMLIELLRRLKYLWRGRYQQTLTCTHIHTHMRALVRPSTNFEFFKTEEEKTESLVFCWEIFSFDDEFSTGTFRWSCKLGV